MRHQKEVAIAAVYLLLSLSGCTHQAAAPFPPERYQRDVIFTKYSPLSRNVEIGRRTLTPLTYGVAQRVLSANREALRAGYWYSCPRGPSKCCPASGSAPSTDTD